MYASTQEEAQKKLREVLRQLDRGEYVELSKMTVGQWLDVWFMSYGMPRWRANTAATHDDSIRLHLKPALGRILLQKLRTDQIQMFINKAAQDGFSPASIRKRLFPLQAALKQAVDNQLLQRSPADTAKLPKMEQKEIEFLTLDEQRQLLPHLPDSTAGRALRFVLGTGLRASEMCGLRWKDVGNDHFTVKQSAQYVRDVNATGEGQPKQKLTVAPPKSKAGWRSIPLMDSMKELLA